MRLSQALKIPVGVIAAGWGGSCIETWIPPEGYRASKNFKELATRKIITVPTPEMIAKERQTGKKPSLHQQPRACWNGMIYPLAPYGIEGAIWYQGCTNRGKWKEYYEMLSADCVKTDPGSPLGKDRVLMRPPQVGWSEK